MTPREMWAAPAISTFASDAWSRAADYRLAAAHQAAGHLPLPEHELPNLWRAAQECYHRRDWLRLTAARDILVPLLDLQGNWQQGLLLNEWGLEAAQALGNQQNIARWTHDHADLLQQRGEYVAAKALYIQAEARWRALGKPELALRSRHMRVLVLRSQGHFAEADSLCRATVAEATELSLGPWLAHPLYALALLARDRGDFAEARTNIELSLTLLDQTSEVAMTAQCHHFLGELALWSNDQATAQRELETSLRLSQRAGIVRRVAATQRLLGDLARRQGQLTEAAALYRDALDCATRLDDRPQLARLLLAQAQLDQDLGRPEAALGALQGAVRIYQDIGDNRGIAWTSLLLAGGLLRQGRGRAGFQAMLTAFRSVLAGRLLRPALLVGLIRREVNRLWLHSGASVKP